ncbi:hypothetical protein AVEN_226462-1 [Araneus ventricosus]|uniref:Uncharacterized protein n=1 Tax=Araneus ventricosus TaxID=182803 RepID=A0A4Y2P620_ARAVE|nr:hypothetical protein AVEN_226462-1 [Araneus ventricosus]
MKCGASKISSPTVWGAESLVVLWGGTQWSKEGSWGLTGGHLLGAVVSLTVVSLLQAALLQRALIAGETMPSVGSVQCHRDKPRQQKPTLWYGQLTLAADSGPWWRTAWCRH